jgi:phosphoadenylyl-sulfate reductase (thioredoxin)
VTESRTEQWAAQLDGHSAADILAWSARQFAPRVAFGTGFGAEGCVLVHMIAERRLPIEVFTLDTGLLFPETYDLWRRLEHRYGLPIRAVRPALSLADQAATFGEALWERAPDRCCAVRKVAPLREELASIDALITGIRREQTRHRAHAALVEWDAASGRTKINPLAAWTHGDVWSFIRTHEVPYNPLHDRAYPSIGCEPCTTAVADGEDPRAGRWRGRDKTECGLHVPAEPLRVFSSKSHQGVCP